MKKVAKNRSLRISKIATSFLNAVSSSKFLKDWPFERGLSSGASSHVRLSVSVTNLSFVSQALIQ